MIKLEDTLEKVAREKFGVQSFRPGQKEIMTDLIHNEDVLGVLATGTGKSLCYQLPTLINEGVTLVVSPLVSLMLDQVRELKANHFKNVIALTSMQTYKERQAFFQDIYSYKLIYISPELLNEDYMQAHLKKIQISLFVVDEAHCISQWGHEFRPDYLELGRIAKSLGRLNILALSATMPEEVQTDIMKHLDTPNIKKHIYPIDRPNIALAIEEMASDKDKLNRIKDILKQFKLSTIIYFSSRKQAEKVANILGESNPNINVAFYHGGLQAQDRIVIQQQFLHNQIDCICCTNAFGMGVNKKDIRLIIHYHIPQQLESFIQEFGRAGRDGLSSVSLVLYKKGDESIPYNLIESEFPTYVQVESILKELYHLYINNIQDRNVQQLICEKYMLKETHWRFLYRHFIKIGIIKNEHIHYDKTLWNKAYISIVQNIDKRVQYKKQRLYLMLDWLHQSNCLRKTLYNYFQNDIQVPTHGCCTRCGFSIRNWEPIEQKEANHKDEWEDLLYYLLQDSNT